MNQPLKIALSYIARGWSPIPVPYRKKDPGVKAWQKLRITTDTAANHFNADRQNIGVLLGKPSADLQDVDLDTPEAMAVAPFLLPDTYAVFGRPGSPDSHSLYKVSDGARATKNYNDPEAKKDDVKARIVELRGTGGMTIFPGSTHEDTGEAIEWSQDGEPASITYADLQCAVAKVAAAALLATYWGSGTRDDLCTATVGFLLRGKWEDEDIENFIRAIAEAADDEKIDQRIEKIARLRLALDDDNGAVPGFKRIGELTTEKVAKAISKWLLVKPSQKASITPEQSASMVQAVNAKHAMVWIDGKPLVMWHHVADNGTPRLSTIEDMKKEWMPETIGRDNPIDIWLASHDRVAYQRLVFKPGVIDTGNEFNLYRGYGVQPKQGDCSLYLDHLFSVACRRNNGLYQYLLQWIADSIVNPADKKGTAIAMGGGQGCGKGTVPNYIRDIYGVHFAQIAGSEVLTGRFNDFLTAKIMVFADEAVFAGDQRALNKLKSYITEKRLFVDKKYVPGFEIDNHMHLMLATNSTRIAPAEYDDRRYVPLEFDESKKGNIPYFEAIERERLNGGMAAFLYMCLHEVKLDLNLRLSPKTDALSEQKLMNLDAIGQFWREMLMKKSHSTNGGYQCFSFDSVVSTTTMHAFYLEHSQRMRERYPSSIDALGRGLRKYLPELTKGEVRASERVNTNIEPRAQVYRLPSLEHCRKALEVALGGPELPWPPADPEPGEL